MNLFAWVKSSRVAVLLVAGCVVSVVFLVWFGFRASREWQRSSVLLVERRTNEAASLLVTGLMRDMRAVQRSILNSPIWEEFTFESPYEVMTLVASAFARYPYPDSFLAWKGGDPPANLIFFTRSERPPAWTPPVNRPNRYPVRIAVNERVAAEILARIQTAAAQGRQSSVAELVIDGARYQVIVQLWYRDHTRQQLTVVGGFTVNLSSIQERYFPQFTREMSRIGENEGLVFGILDDLGTVVVGPRPFAIDFPVSRRAFPLAFFDPAVSAMGLPPDLPRRTWTVIVGGAADPTLSAAIQGGNRTGLLAAFAAAMLACGLVLSARAIRANAELTTMRAEFVSSITHELKTPLASIRALGDSLTSGRVPSPEMQREYAGLVVQEAKRLTRLVDNLLAHARVTDIADLYSFEAVEINMLVSNVVSMFAQQLRQAGFHVRVDVPSTLPRVRADRLAMELALENLIDNAIRYSAEFKDIEITGGIRDRSVAIQIRDRGIGIAPEDLNRVTLKFVRGRNATVSGSGLGLSIVARVVKDHRGRLVIESTLREGTMVTVELPCFGNEHFQADRERPPSPSVASTPAPIR
jgi:signal transduction histidine kinase